MDNLEQFQQSDGFFHSKCNEDAQSFGTQDSQDFGTIPTEEVLLDYHIRNEFGGTVRVLGDEFGISRSGENDQESSEK